METLVSLFSSSSLFDQSQALQISIPQEKSKSFLKIQLLRGNDSIPAECQCFPVEPLHWFTNLSKNNRKMPNFRSCLVTIPHFWNFIRIYVPAINDDISMSFLFQTTCNKKVFPCCIISSRHEWFHLLTKRFVWLCMKLDICL